MLALASTSSSSYTGELTRAMEMLSRHPKTIFVGQNVVYGGQRMCATFKDIPMDKRLEFPVAEDFQLGFCIGLSFEGYIPVCVYPRMDFLVLAFNQLINHLDKIALVSTFRPKVIIRTAVGSKKPLDAGPQHTQNHCSALWAMLKTVEVYECLTPTQVMQSYKAALISPKSCLIVEHMDSYD